MVFCWRFVNECVNCVAWGVTTTSELSATVPISVSLSSYCTIGRPKEREREGERDQGGREGESFHGHYLSGKIRGRSIATSIGLRFSPGDRYCERIKTFPLKIHRCTGSLRNCSVIKRIWLKKVTHHQWRWTQWHWLMGHLQHCWCLVLRCHIPFPSADHSEWQRVGWEAWGEKFHFLHQ